MDPAIEVAIGVAIEVERDEAPRHHRRLLLQLPRLQLPLPRRLFPAFPR